MPADRFFLDAELKNHSTVSLLGPEHHHLAHVMKLQKGESLELVNGRGDLAIGKILELNKKNALVQIVQSDHQPDTKTPRILLGLPLMRASKLEWIIEKGTELGVDSFLFYPGDHSELKTLSSRHLERFSTLCISAIKQSGRLYLPSIETLPSLTNLLKKEAQILFGDPRATKSIDCGNASQILFVSGPERGFSTNEEALLREKGEGVLLNRYILRAETAPIAAASILGMKRL